MKTLELKIPPPLLFLICIALMYLNHMMLSLFVVTLPFRELVLFGFLLSSGYFGLSGLYEFRKARTSVHPVRVDKASTIVASGVYRFTRNPMYLGLLLLLLGYGYWQQNLLNLLICLGFVLYMNRFQIQPEERFLEQKFGKTYTEYKAQVRRWI